MLAVRGDGIPGKTVAVSGSGNVAQYTVEKVNELGGRVITLSDSNGTIVDDNGIDAEKLAFVIDLKNVRRGRIREYCDRYKGSKYLEGQRPWVVPCDVALPSATQNEINAEDAKALLSNGVKCIAEGANMPSTPDAVDQFLASKVL